MKKSTKRLLIGLSYVLVIALAIGATIAYLTSTDDDVNVMTLGNVKIEQVEQERDADGNLVDFTQSKPAFPAVGDIVWDDTKINVNGTECKVFSSDLKNVVDKIVTVKNTGKSDAYVRTIVAIEAPEGDPNNLIHVNINGTGLKHSNWKETTINGEDYVYMVFTYNDALAPNDVSTPSLVQVFLDEKATNEDVAKFGDTWEILALSQAVQVNGFEDVGAEAALNTAFGGVDDNATTWFESIAMTKVSTVEEFKKALNDGKTNIYLNSGTYNIPSEAKGKTLTISGTKDSIIEVIPAGQGEANGQLDYSLDGSNVTFNGVTIKTNGQLYAGYARLSGTYNDCVIQNTYNLGTGNSVFNGCEINITNEYLRVGGAYSAEFNNCTFNTDGRAILVFQDGTSVEQTVTVKDCTFNATAAANTWNGIHVAAVSIDGTNGTYVVNLEGNNTVDSDFNGLWQIKTGEANVTVNE